MLGQIFQRLFGDRGYRLIDRGQGAGVEIEWWTRPEPRPSTEEIATWLANWDGTANGGYGEWRPGTPEAIAQAARDAEARAAKIAANRITAKQLLASLDDATLIALRALVSLFVQEINSLRKNAGLTEYTAAQVRAALEAKVDQINGA
jgi:hypothetical protein